LIHDEILLEVPRDLVEQVKAVALKAMTSPKLRERYLGDIPLAADCNVAESWGDAHSLVMTQELVPKRRLIN